MIKSKHKRIISNKVDNTSNNLHRYFRKVIYLGLKAPLDNHLVKYKKILDNSSITSEGILENLECKREKVTIVSISAVALHPWINFH